MSTCFLLPLFKEVVAFQRLAVYFYRMALKMMPVWRDIAATSETAWFMAKLFLYLMTTLYVAAGINHFWHRETYMRIMPPYIPGHAALVAISGVCEILFGLLLLFPATRIIGAWLIIALLIAVFPANIHMTVDWYRRSHPLLWIAIARLPLQILLIWWAWQYTKSAA